METTSLLPVNGEKDISLVYERIPEPNVFTLPLAILCLKEILTVQEDIDNFKLLVDKYERSIGSELILRKIPNFISSVFDGRLPVDGDIVMLSQRQNIRSFVYDGIRERLEEFHTGGKDSHFCIPEQFGRVVCKNGNYNLTYYQNIVKDIPVDFTHFSWYDELIRCEIKFIAEEKRDTKIMKIYLIKQKEGSYGRMLIPSFSKQDQEVSEEDNIKNAVLMLCYEPTTLEPISKERYEMWFSDTDINEDDIFCVSCVNRH